MKCFKNIKKIHDPRFYSCDAWLFFSKFKCLKFKLQTWYFLSDFWLNLKLLDRFFQHKNAFYQKYNDLHNLFTNDPLSKRCDKGPKLAQNRIKPFHTLIIRSTQETRFLVF